MLSTPKGLAFVAACLLAAPACAGEGHDHGHEKADAHAGGPASPRFYAISENFELVGVVDGRHVTLYLDRAADNAPVPEAMLELDMGGTRVAVTRHGEGEYEAQLPQALAPGVIPVTATVIAQGESDLLAGELDIHEADAADSPHLARSWWIAGLGSAFLGAALAIAWALRRRLATRRPGGAA